MATTRLSDVIVPAIAGEYMVQAITEKSRLINSGIVVRDPQLDGYAAGGGRTFTMPHWNQLGGESSVGSDDPTQEITPDKITAGSCSAIRHVRTKAWSSMTLTGLLAGDDPSGRIMDMVAGWWDRDRQKMLVASANGVFADNVANDAGDMVVNLSNDDVLPVGAANKISATAILMGKQTMGDAADSLTAIMMHSVIHTSLQQQELIEYMPNNSADIGFGTYLGYTVIVDDNCPAVMGTNRITYTTYLVGMGAFGYGETALDNAVTTRYIDEAGNGMGEERLFTRTSFILHPYGMTFKPDDGADLAGISPTNAELATAAKWDRVYDRKNVPLVAIKTNG